MSLTRVSRFGFVNAYLVEEEDGLTLVDTAIPGSAKAIQAAAEELGRPIVRIALTHAHGDHIGSLDALAEDAPGHRGPRSPSATRGCSPRTRRPTPASRPRPRCAAPTRAPRPRPTRTLAPGDRVGSLEVVAAPGHTPGHIAFLDTRDRTLIAGDAYSTIGGVATSAKVNPLFPLPVMATWHKPTALETARALRALDPSRLAVGHGPIVDAPGAAMDKAIETPLARSVQRATWADESTPARRVPHHAGSRRRPLRVAVGDVVRSSGSALRSKRAIASRRRGRPGR